MLALSNRLKSSSTKRKLQRLLLCWWCLSLISSVNTIMLNLALTADDVRFASARCQEEYGGPNRKLKELWSYNELPDEPHTHCYVKCLMSRMGLIDEETMGLHFTKFHTILTSMEIDITQLCPKNFRFNVNLDGKCINYYYQWVELRNNCGNLMKYVLYEEEMDNKVGRALKLYSKPLGLMASEFCKMVPEVSVLPKIFAVNAEMYHRCRLCCIFRHFHYFDANGKADAKEIKRSYHEAHRLTEENERAIEACVSHANIKYSGYANCEMAFKLHNCLLETTGGAQNVYEYRDSKSRDY